MRLAASGSRDGSTALYTLRDGKRVRALREPGGAEIEQVMPSDAHASLDARPSPCLVALPSPLP